MIPPATDDIVQADCPPGDTRTGRETKMSKTAALATDAMVDFWGAMFKASETELENVLNKWMSPEWKDLTKAAAASADDPRQAKCLKTVPEPAVLDSRRDQCLQQTGRQGNQPPYGWRKANLLPVHDPVKPPAPAKPKR
jgi:hypothetical protein